MPVSYEVEMGPVAGSQNGISDCLPYFYFTLPIHYLIRHHLDNGTTTLTLIYSYSIVKDTRTYLHPHDVFSLSLFSTIISHYMPG